MLSLHHVVSSVLSSCRARWVFVPPWSCHIDLPVLVSYWPPCARRSLAGAVIAPRCCREPAGAVVTCPCCREPAGTVVTCHPGLHRVICAFVIGQCWPPLVLVALCCPSLHSLRRVVCPCACRVMSSSPHSLCCPGICYVVPTFSCCVVPGGGRLDPLVLVTLSDVAPGPCPFGSCQCGWVGRVRYLPCDSFVIIVVDGGCSSLGGGGHWQGSSTMGGGGFLAGGHGAEVRCGTGIGQ